MDAISGEDPLPLSDQEMVKQADRSAAQKQMHPYEKPREYYQSEAVQKGRDRAVRMVGTGLEGFATGAIGQLAMDYGGRPVTDDFTRDFHEIMRRAPGMSPKAAEAAIHAGWTLSKDIGATPGFVSIGAGVFNAIMSIARQHYVNTHPPDDEYHPVKKHKDLPEDWQWWKRALAVVLLDYASIPEFAYAAQRTPENPGTGGADNAPYTKYLNTFDR